MGEEIGIEGVEPQTVVCVTAHTTLERLGDTLESALMEAWEYVERSRLEVVGPPFTRYHTFNEEHIELSTGFPVAAAPAGLMDEPPSCDGDGSMRARPSSSRVEVGELPGGRAAALTYLGSYFNLPGAYRALGEWIVEQGLTPEGAPWEVYVSDPGSVRDPESWQTRVFWPVR
jgi:AraC family transcriptional regulator